MKKIIFLLILGTSTAITVSIKAQSPPEPGGNPYSETPLGGAAAPVGSGTAVMMALAFAYGTGKLIRKHSKTT